MCGILGFNWEDKKLMKKGLEEISHRGPDQSGTYFDRNVSLGHNRLSILDLSIAGKQPMSNEEGTIWITFNGEIYNFKKIKENLKKNHKFISETDTEILIHLYEEKGVEMLKDLVGMFAFCIYDSKRKIFFIARDRLGIKPLYYYKKDKKIIFCSEIKGILEYEDSRREVNKDALLYFLSFRANISEETMFKGIKKLNPGHFMIFNIKTASMLIKKYWDLNETVTEKPFKEYSSELKDLLTDAVKIRLVSDVPYGAYLSGGVDSGTIVTLMNQFTSQPIKTFSVGFEEEKPDTELNEAKFLSEKIGTDHHELWINRNSIKHLPEIVYHLDEPMSDPTSIPLYLLSEYSKKYCTVILTGEGSDEIFAGYPQYRFMKLRSKLIEKLPANLKLNLPQIVKKTPDFLLNKSFKFASSLGEKGIERFDNFTKSESPAEQYLNQVAIFNEKEKEELTGVNQNLYTKYDLEYFQNLRKDNLITKCQLMDLKESMVEDLLMKVDKNTMAFAIEGRVPFLDHRVVELAFRMPEKYKLNFFQNKIILRKTFKDFVPNQTLKRKKRHFFVPIDLWLKKEVSGLKDDLLSKKVIEKQKLFNYSYIEKIEKDFNNSKLFYSRQLWSLLCFQIWYRRFIEGEEIEI